MDKKAKKLVRAEVFLRDKWRHKIKLVINDIPSVVKEEVDPQTPYWIVEVEKLGDLETYDLEANPGKMPIKQVPVPPEQPKGQKKIPLSRKSRYLTIRCPHCKVKQRYRIPIDDSVYARTLCDSCGMGIAVKIKPPRKQE